ncbi:MAG: hypothetical protein ACLPKB_07365 [Xanthobacteraceae bacterium]
MKLRILPASIVVLFQILLFPPAALSARSITATEYDDAWTDAITSLLTFASRASPSDTAKLTSDSLPGLQEAQTTFERAIELLLRSDPPDVFLSKHLLMMPICQELAAAMTLIVEGVRTGDYAVAYAAQSWMAERLIDLSVAMKPFERAK